MRKYYLHLTFILFITFLTSCYSKLVQKAYITNPPNVSLFDTSKVVKMKIAANLRYIENQMSFPLSDKWGIASDVLFGLCGQYGGDVGLVYYKRIKDKSYFEISSGYGYFNAHSFVNHIGSLGIMPGGDYYSQHIESKYHKIFFQPSYFLYKNNKDFGLTIRMSLSYFTKYNCSYSITPYSGEYNWAPTEYAEAKFKNKLGFTIEPMLSYRFKRKNSYRYLQIGMCFSEKFHSLDSLERGDQVGGGIGPYIHYENYQSFPLHANFFINYGIEFNIGKRRKEK